MPRIPTRRGRGDVSVSDFEQGCILYIKALDNIDYQQFTESLIHEGGLNHPALVLRRDTGRADHVEIYPLTTFGGQSVQDRRRMNPWKNYLPIWPKTPFNESIPQLEMDGPLLRKAGYVHITKSYTMHVDMLRTYDWDFSASHYRLTKASFKVVARRLNVPLEGDNVPHQISNYSLLPTAEPAIPARTGYANNQSSQLLIDLYSQTPTMHTPLIPHRPQRSQRSQLPYPSHSHSYPPPRSNDPTPSFLSTLACFLCRNWRTIVVLLALCGAATGTYFATIWLIGLIGRAATAIANEVRALTAAVAHGARSLWESGKALPGKMFSVR